MKQKIYRIRREWDGETCFILGGGASLKGFDATRLKGKGRVVALNNAGLLPPALSAGSSGGPSCECTPSGVTPAESKDSDSPARGPYYPEADVIFWHDDRWFARWFDDPRFLVTRPGLRLTVAPPGGSTRDPKLRRAMLAAAASLGVEVIGRADRADWSDDPAKLAGVCSGSRALNFAARKGPARIILLGFDMRPGHWHGEHAKTCRPDAYAIRYVPAIRRMAPYLARAGVEVVNAVVYAGPHGAASSSSALDCFPCVSIDSVL